MTNAVVYAMSLCQERFLNKLAPLIIAQWEDFQKDDEGKTGELEKIDPVRERQVIKAMEAMGLSHVIFEAKHIVSAKLGKRKKRGKAAFTAEQVEEQERLISQSKVQADQRKEELEQAIIQQKSTEDEMKPVVTGKKKFTVDQVLEQELLLSQSKMRAALPGRDHP